MKRLQIADLFCGAGGTSTGAIEAIEMLGYQARLTAINHWPVAIATHGANHPEARHFCTSIDNVNPRDLYMENGLDLLWASPECTHHSSARGGRPINEQSRATAWCVARWAEALRPPVILVENVPEFKTWGAIGANGRPLKSRRGETFLAWVNALRSLGYRVDWRVLCAADYGDPTTRRRLFVQAVRGRRKIVWPDPTHAAELRTDLLGKRKAWIPARDIIDWSLPGVSIFERKRPLSEKTLRRIWAGLEKFGLKSFITPGYGERKTPSPRTHGTSQPFLIKVAGTEDRPPKSVEEPFPTVTAGGIQHGIAQPFIIRLQHNTAADSLEKPLGTVLANGTHFGLAEPFLIHTAHGKKRRARGIGEPFPTVTGRRGDIAIIEPALLPQHSGGGLRPVDQPVPTVTADGAIGMVQPFLVEYYGTGGAESVESPLGTVTTKPRFGLARPIIKVNGARYLLDIRFRMLQPHELAAAQGFRHDYKFTGTKTEQVKQIGNAVPRNLARALCLAVLSQRPNITALLKAEVAA